MGYEAKRIFRNKVIFVMLLVFAIVMIVLLFFVQSADMNYVAAVYNESLSEEQAQEMVTVIEEGIGARVVFVDSDEAGMDMAKRAQAVFYIRLEKGAKEKDPPHATLYYDAANRMNWALARDLKDDRTKIAYDEVLEYLKSWGIKLNTAYFETVQIEPLTKKYTLLQMPFAEEIAACVCLILMLGIAYSFARDRETNVSKNVAYIPIGHHTYFMSKLIPYFILGMLEMLILCVIGSNLMKIGFETNLFLVWIISGVFVSAVLSLGLLFSTMRSQISTVFLGMMSMLLPLFVDMLVVTAALPTFVRVLLCCLPVTPFLALFNGMVYNGVILWQYIPILAAQSVVYYFAALLIVKRGERV